MIAVIASFTDDPARLELRPRHRELLAELHEQGLVVAAGPFGDQSGSLVLFATDDVAEVKAALARDPYYQAPGVTIEKIQPWSIIAGSVG
ncbi:YciI family protein [Agrococcus sp. HG114]|uniref:YciI family protein n=1 Tax=Agrococcus sp. HG114 TaxID=2969757 RepID=UPI00215B5B75|nr:YciI family protein [Agrococcus sp. HG114]MCR8671875.1 YciI family protein [Agrococcus sp. HG114]